MQTWREEVQDSDREELWAKCVGEPDREEVQVQGGANCERDSDREELWAKCADGIWK